MSDQAQSGTAAPDPWFVRSLRLTLFTKGMVEGDPSWWEKIVGSEPESESRQKAQGLFQQDGPFGKGRLSVTITGGARIDWVWRATDPEPPTFEFSVLGEYIESTETFTTVMSRWLDISPTAVRLAFGAEFVQPVESVRDGYLRLREYLKQTVKVDPESSDFYYRINRSKPSKSVGEALKINRLTSWSVMQVRQLSLVLPGGREFVGQFSAPAVSQAVCRLELDINSSPEYSDALERDQLKALLGELSVLGLQIAEEGDVP